MKIMQNLANIFPKLITKILSIATMIINVYCSDHAGPSSTDDYLDRLKAVIGKNSDLVYLDLRKIPENDTQLLPFKKEYVFLNGTDVIECTVEGLLKEYILGDKSIAEFSSFKINAALAFHEQKISVRAIKTLMNLWLERNLYRFIRHSGCPDCLMSTRERIKKSGALGLYKREEFLESCKQPEMLSLLAFILMDAAFGQPQDAKTSKAEEVIDQKSKEKKQKQAERKKQYRKRKAEKKAKEKAAITEHNDKEITESFAADQLKENAETIADALLSEPALLPLEVEFDSTGDGLSRADHSMDDAVLQSLEPQSSPSRYAVSPAASPAKKFQKKSDGDRAPSSNPSSNTSPGKNAYNIVWSGGAKENYFEVLNMPENAAHLLDFRQFLTTVRTMGTMAGGIRKMESADGFFSYKINRSLRAIFTVNEASKTITFFKGIRHYKGMFE